MTINYSNRIEIHYHIPRITRIGKLAKREVQNYRFHKNKIKVEFFRNAQINVTENPSNPIRYFDITLFYESRNGWKGSYTLDRILVLNSVLLQYSNGKLESDKDFIRAAKKWFKTIFNFELYLLCKSNLSQEELINEMVAIRNKESINHLTKTEADFLVLGLRSILVHNGHLIALGLN